MADYYPIPGWKSLGPNKSNVYETKIPAKKQASSTILETFLESRFDENLVVNTNKATGNFDVYEPNLVGYGQPIYSYNASNNKITEVNKDKFKQYFDGTKGKAQLENINKKIKIDTLKIAEKEAGPSPAQNVKKELEDLKKSPGYKSEANKATKEETPTTPAEGTVESLDTGKEVTGTKTSGFGNFIYPEDLGSTKQDVIKFSMLKYKPSGLKFLEPGPSSGRTETKDRQIIGTVVLPIPSGISDTNACVWGENSINAVEAAAAAAAFQGITKGIGAGVKEAGDSLTKALADPATKTGIAALFTANAVGTDGGAILARTAGAVLNPNLELLFNGPTLRPFSFTFKMSARNKGEAKQIIGILNFFKRGMSPIKTESNLFLKAPHTFRIQYLDRRNKDAVDHPYIGRIKECALQSINMLYTPHGEYATYTDGVMVSYEMQMQFQELEPIFNSDYEGLSGIGF